MALVGGGTTEGLRVDVDVTGAKESAGKLDQVAGAAQRVGAAASDKAAPRVGRLRAGLSSLRNMGQSIIGTFARVSGVLGLGGGLAIGGLLRETADVERSLNRIAWQSGRGAAGMQRMRDAARSISGETGKSRVEVLAAIGAAEDMGLTFEQAEAHMKNLVLWSDLLGVNTDQASGAVGALNKALGGNADINQLMSMVDAAARNAGMDEGLMMNVVTKVAPQLQGVEGLGDIKEFFQVIGGIGEELAGDPKAIAAGIKTLNKSFTDPKLQKTFKQFGITGDNASQVLISMAQKLAGNANALDSADLPDEVLFLARTMSDNIDTMNAMGKAVDGAAGDADEFARRLADHANDPAIKWASMMERMKAAVEPLATGALQWLAGHSDEIVAAGQTLVAMLQMLGSAIESAVSYILKKLGLDSGADRATAATGAAQAREVATSMILGGAEAAPTGSVERARGIGRSLRYGMERERDLGERALAVTEQGAYGNTMLNFLRDVGPQEGKLMSEGFATEAMTTAGIPAAIARAVAGFAGRINVQITNSTDAEVTARREGEAAPALAGAGA